MESKHDYDQPPRLENEDSYEQWKKAISLWTIVTDIQKEKQAIAVALRLKGKARKAALEINIDDLNSDDGMNILLKKLDEVFTVDPMFIYKAFQAFDSLKKHPSETFKTYAKNFNALYTHLKEFGIAFSEKLLTLKLLSGAQLSESQVKDILRRTDEGGLESAMLNLICQDKDSKSFASKSGDTGGSVQQTSTPPEKSVSNAGIFKPPASSINTNPTASTPPAQQKIQSPEIDPTLKGTLVAEKKAGSWNCPTCCIQNPATDAKCPCCETPNPATPKTDDAKNRFGPSSAFAFGLPAKPSGFSFRIPSSSTKDQSSSATSKPIFGAQQSQTKKPGLLDLPTSQTGPSLFRAATTTGQKPTKSFFGVSETVETSNQQLPLAARTEGQWNCPTCFAPNGPTDDVCPCCGEVNPSAPPSTKGSYITSHN